MSIRDTYTDFDDRARDTDIERLRSSAAHVIDLARTATRMALDAGEHPVDSMMHAITLLETWERALDVPGAQPPEVYTREVASTLALLRERLGGAEQLWEWLLLPNPALIGGRTPLRALVGHGVRDLARLAHAMPPATAPSDSPAATAGAGPAGAEGDEPGVLPVAGWEALAGSGVIGELELIAGRPVMGEYDFVFSLAQARAAAELGLRVRSSIDDVLGDAAARAEVSRRVSGGEPRDESADDER